LRVSGQHVLASLKDDSALVGQDHLAALAQQERSADLFLERLDHFADGGLGDEHALGGEREALLPDHFDEITQRAQLHWRPL
jgi:hypothetical protein